MDKLKCCPFCGGEAKIVHFDDLYKGNFIDRYFVQCVDYPNCGGKIISKYTKEEAIDAWNNRYEEPNKPLTLDELRKMDGKPVWIECKECLENGEAWCILEPQEQTEKKYVILVSRNENRYGRFAAMLDCYGEGWIGYRRKPKGANNANKT